MRAFMIDPDLIMHQDDDWKTYSQIEMIMTDYRNFLMFWGKTLKRIDRISLGKLRIKVRSILK